MKKLVFSGFSVLLSCYLIFSFQNCSPLEAQRFAEADSAQPVVFEKKLERAEAISPYDFPGETLSKSERAEMLNAIGSGVYFPLSQFYSSLEDVYSDFNIEPDLIQSCDERNKRFLDSPKPSFTKTFARQYYCMGEFDTEECRQKYYKKIRLEMCLDLDDSIDWLAIQAALLNAEGRVVTIPPEKLFLINQSIVIPSNTRLLWEGTAKPHVDGLVYRAKNASYLRWARRAEPVLPEAKGGVNFGTGSLLVNGNTPFIYSGPNPYYTEGITKNIHLYFPMIDGADTPGENGISFAQGSENMLIHGGVIKNIKIQKERAGGKAIQCEAGCRGLKIKGVEILDSFIGINSNAFEKYKRLQKFASGPVSELHASRIKMRNVDVPLNAMQDMVDPDAQKVIIENFYFENCGRMPTNIEKELFGGTPIILNPVDLISRKIQNKTFLATVEPRFSYKYGGLITGRGAKNITIRNGKLMNSSSYRALAGLVLGYYVNSSVENVEYTIQIDCQTRSDGTRHPSCR